MHKQQNYFQSSDLILKVNRISNYFKSGNKTTYMNTNKQDVLSEWKEWSRVLRLLAESHAKKTYTEPTFPWKAFLSLFLWKNC